VDGSDAETGGSTSVRAGLQNSTENSSNSRDSFNIGLTSPAMLSGKMLNFDANIDHTSGAATLKSERMHFSVTSMMLKLFMVARVFTISFLVSIWFCCWPFSMTEKTGKESMVG
jgi:hypothetical protein